MLPTCHTGERVALYHNSDYTSTSRLADRQPRDRAAFHHPAQWASHAFHARPLFFTRKHQHFVANLARPRELTSASVI